MTGADDRSASAFVATSAARSGLPDFAVDERGVASGTRFVASPNFDERPAGTAVTLLVVHGISLPPGAFGGDAVLALFTKRLDSGAHPYYARIAGLRVAAHFLIRRDGEVIQFVACARRAWHAGSSAWRGRARCNDFSIGIELEGADDVPYADAQYISLARLARGLRARYPVRDIAGHADIAPGRKTDPGAAFDWTRLDALLADAP
ncbi:MAG: 1,6-anhydro-N-acetylmuramyl-L-alanine amidase AmpD [Burkholderiales bacterium]|nr:1,6-anhydro-N-acetylmuramyl-L-alanine amidase AmpD [Burkholderiales bacterium]